jgi:hypothetical protein
MPEYTGGRRIFFVTNRCRPLWREGLRVYGHVDSAFSSWVRGGGQRVIEPITGEWLLLLLLL